MRLVCSVLLALAIVLTVLAGRRSRGLLRLRAETRVTGAVGAAANGRVVVPPQMQIEAFPFTFRYSVGNDGVFKHEVAAEDGADFQSLRQMGAAAVQPTESVHAVRNCGDRWLTTVDASGRLTLYERFGSPVLKLRCVLADYLLLNKDRAYLAMLHNATCTVMATTSVQDGDLRVFHLVSTFLGLGVLSAPRGSVLTAGLFYAGYTPLLDDVADPLCGQKEKSFDRYKCGFACARTLPTDASASGAPIWELASPDGFSRLQFFDNGHVRFGDTRRSLPFFTTEQPVGGGASTVYPRCSNGSGATDLVALNKRAVVVRDKVLLRGITYSGDNPKVQVSELAMCLQVSDSGKLVWQKDYRYGTMGIGESHPRWNYSGARNSHAMVQAVLPLVSGTQQADNFVDFAGGVRLMMEDDSEDSEKQKHRLMGNSLMCSSWDALAQWEASNGAVVARTGHLPSVTLDGASGIYVLWWSPIALRLLSVPVTPGLLAHVAVSAAHLRDWARSLWITPLIKRWWFVGSGSTIASHSTACMGRNMPDDFKPPLYTQCGAIFRAPASPSAAESVVFALRSPSKRYAFMMWSNGAVQLRDISTDAVLFAPTGTDAC